MRREKQFDQLLEQRRSGMVQLSELRADDAVRMAAAESFARLNDIAIPPDVAQRIEARVRNQASALQAERQLAKPRRSPLREVSRRPVMRRAWIAAFAATVVLLLTFLGITTVAANSLPGDPFYGIRQVEQHVALAWTGDQSARASLQLTQLQQAIADLSTVVSMHRSDAAISEALATVAADTQASQKAVHGLPAGKPRVALEQTLANTLFDERTSLHRLLSQVGWESHVAFTTQLGALGEAVPSITGVTVSWDSSDTLTLTITGKNFAPGARLVIDGSSRGNVLQGSTTTLRVSVHTSDMLSHMMSRIGVVNPDGTAAQFAYSGNWDQHGQPGPGNHHSTPGPTPWRTPEPWMTPQPGDGHYPPTPGPGSGGSPMPGNMHGGHR
jgi:hypothetical protein